MLHVSIRGKKRAIFYGWVIVAVGTIVQTIQTGVAGQGLGAFLVPLEKEFGWSKTELAGARSVMQLEGGLLGPIEGWLVDRFGPRTIMMVGAFIFGLSMILLGFINSLLSYYLVYLLLALGTSLAGSIALFVALNNWFSRKRTLAMALTQTGNGFSGIFVIPILLLALNAFGWRTASIGAGVCVWVILIPIALFIRRAPEQYGVLPDGAPTPTAGMPQAAHSGHRSGHSGPNVDFTLQEALRTRSFWFISLGHGMAITIISAVTVHQFAHMEQGVGLASGSIALMVALIGVSTVIGRIVGGILGDWGDMRFLAAGCMIGTSIALAIFAVSTTLWQVSAFAVLYGMFWGMRGPMMSSIRGQYFGRTSFGKIMGTSNVLTTLCSMLGPVLAGAMADAQGDYVDGFLILAVVSGLGCLFFIFTPKPAPPNRPAQVR